MARQQTEGGFTIVEVVVAIVILSIGVIALVGSSALVTRMVGQGRRTTQASQVATQRLETLRRQAFATTPPCTSLAGGTAARPGRMSESWTVVANGSTRILRVIVTYPRTTGMVTDTLTTTIRCV